MPPKKNNTGKKALPLSNSSQPIQDSETTEECFTMEEEVLWCIKKLESNLMSESITPKLLKSTVLALKTLKSNKAPVIKKRQVMRMSCGDYRKAMLGELKKASNGSKKMNLLPVKDTKCGSLLNTKKNVDSPSETECTSDSKFCFNFSLPTDEELRLDFQDLKIDVTNSS